VRGRHPLDEGLYLTSQGDARDIQTRES
jgi:hypothetical protein